MEVHKLAVLNSYGVLNLKYLQTPKLIHCINLPAVYILDISSLLLGSLIMVVWGSMYGKHRHNHHKATCTPPHHHAHMYDSNISQPVKQQTEVSDCNNLLLSNFLCTYFIYPIKPYTWYVQCRDMQWQVRQKKSPIFLTYIFKME